VPESLFCYRQLNQTSSKDGRREQSEGWWSIRTEVVDFNRCREIKTKELAARRVRRPLCTGLCTYALVEPSSAQDHCKPFAVRDLGQDAGETLTEWGFSDAEIEEFLNPGSRD
jgi:hypothetical protein